MSADCCAHHAPDQTTTANRSVTRRAALVGGLALGAAPFLPGLARPAAAEGDRDFGFLPPRPASEVHTRPIMFPVLPDPTLGQATWTDTYLAPRGGGRRHEGQDLMGKKMLKLLACVSGTIVELRHRSTGNSLYLKGDDGWYYCYLHINNDRPGTDDGSNLFEHAFAPGMVQGKRVQQGDHIAYLGDSGNAEESGAHLHFEIRMPNTNMWNAAAVNAKYSLNAAAPAKLNTPVSNRYAPFSGALAFVVRQADDFLGGAPDWDWLVSSVASVDTGGKHPDTFIAEQVDHASVTTVVNPIIRLQLACFGTTPDWSRVNVLTRLVRAGATLESAADFTVSQAGLGAGSISNELFVERLALNMNGRIRSGNTLRAQARQLQGGLTRGQLVRQLVEERTYRIDTAAAVRSSTVWMSMLGRTMPTVHLDKWSALDKTSSTALRQLATSLRSSGEYRSRIAAAQA